VETGLKRRWPKNLSVKNIEVIGSLNVNDIEYLSSIQGELILSLDCVAAENMYQLLERIGPLVKTLYIGDRYKSRRGIVYVRSDIIVERLLAACPNLEHFEFNTTRSVVQDDGYVLQPSAFKNYQW
jgi:hypothetical protein